MPTTIELLAAELAIQGITGPAGPQGPQGDTGATGAEGPQGPPGADGADGANGAAGADGANGADGADGATGATGPAGADGAQGPAGAAGNTILYGTTAPDDVTDGVDGDFYIRTTTLYIYGPKAGGAWPAGTSLVGYVYVAYASDNAGTDFTTTFDANLDYIAVKASLTPLTPVAGDFAGLWKNYRGATGATGATGAQGDTGATGAEGPQGPPGADGADGANGAAGADGDATAYTPTTSSDWDGTAPTTIGEALDRLATLAKALNGGTGP